jgi:hypothetical protein
MAGSKFRNAIAGVRDVIEPHGGLGWDCYFFRQKFWVCSEKLVWTVAFEAVEGKELQG